MARSFADPPRRLSPPGYAADQFIAQPFAVIRRLARLPRVVFARLVLVALHSLDERDDREARPPVGSVEVGVNSHFVDGAAPVGVAVRETEQVFQQEQAPEVIVCPRAVTKMRQIAERLERACVYERVNVLVRNLKCRHAFTFRARNPETCTVPDRRTERSGYSLRAGAPRDRADARRDRTLRTGRMGRASSTPPRGRAECRTPSCPHGTKKRC